DPGGVARDVGPVLVDHRDDPQGDPDAPDVEPVRPAGAVDRLTHPGGQRGDLAPTLDQTHHPLAVPSEAAEGRGRRPPLLPPAPPRRGGGGGWRRAARPGGREPGPRRPAAPRSCPRSTRWRARVTRLWRAAPTPSPHRTPGEHTCDRWERLARLHRLHRPTSD